MVETLKSEAWKGSPENAQSNLPAQSRASKGRQPKTGSFHILNIAMDGDPTTSLGNLVLCSITYAPKKKKSAI